MAEPETIEEMQQRIKKDPAAVLAELETVCFNCCAGCRKRKLCWEYQYRPMKEDHTTTGN